MISFEDIKNNLDDTHSKSDKAAISSGRNPDDVQLIVVTKTKPADIVQLAVEAGAKCLGENYPEETAEKIAQLGNDFGPVSWHMIGHLQSRKAKLVVEHFQMLHSLDSLHLAERLNRLLSECEKKMPVLLEVNISGEDSKWGWSAWDESQWDKLALDVEAVCNFNHIEVQGLMCMPPLFQDSEDARPYFVKTRKLFEYFSKRLPKSSWKHLSMGTSSDYEVAIQEGATFIRVGQAVLGPRLYPNKK